MRITPLPEFQSEALLTGQDFAPIAALIEAEAGVRGLVPHVGHGRSVWCALESGEFGAKKRGEDVLVFARAHRPEDLAAMQQALSAPLARHLPEAARALLWPSATDSERLPVNFSFAEVEHVRRLSADFLRLRLRAPDLHRLALDESMHFRLVLPAPGQASPAWPHVGANGQTLWPQGKLSPHRPVYTVRAIDARLGWMDVDIFVHAGGRVSGWAADVRPGTRIGLMGPSGGGIPEARDLLLAGDEAAYPAMARILESRGGDSFGRVFLLGNATDYPWPEATRFTFVQLSGGAQALCATLRDAPPAAQGFLWIATERAAIAGIRHVVLDELGHDRGLTHLSAYWSAKD